MLYVFCPDLEPDREIWRLPFAATQRVKNSDTTSKGAPTPRADRERIYVFGDLLALDHDDARRCKQLRRGSRPGTLSRGRIRRGTDPHFSNTLSFRPHGLMSLWFKLPRTQPE